MKTLYVGIYARNVKDKASDPCSGDLGQVAWGEDRVGCSVLISVWYS